jgi:transcriptional regulator with XRE-family HTH domain
MVTRCRHAAAIIYTMVSTPKQFSATVGAEIRAEAAAQGTRIKDLAARMGINRVVLIRYLDGTRDFPLTVLYRAAEALGVSPRVIIQRASERMAANE